jgi:hypothetical protein
MDDNTSFFAVRDQLAAVSAGSVAADAAAGCGGHAAPSSSLECLRNTVPKDEQAKVVDEGPITDICGDRCKDWFCPHCAKVQGPRLQARLIDRVQSWEHPMMITFTLDRDLFSSAEEGFKWVTEKRAIAKLMKSLRPYLLRNDWFCVIEFQKDGGWPHWHVLMDSQRVPIKEVEGEWRRFVPPGKRHLIRPSIGTLGICRYSKPEGFHNSKHAGLYVTKYLTKYPDHGFPDWVMQASYRIRRYSTSRGFWGEMTHRKAPKAESEHHARQRSHTERIDGCCRTCSVHDVKTVVDEQTGKVKRKRRFMGRIRCHGRVLVQLLHSLGESVAGVGLYARGGFVRFQDTWPAFVQAVGSLVENCVEKDSCMMSLRFVASG